MTEKQPDARPMYRWLAGISVPVFVLLAVFAAFPQIIGDDEGGSVAFAVLFIWGAICFAVVAITGRFPSSGKERLQLFIAAKKYVDGEMTLDEYGTRTKEILGS